MYKCRKMIAVTLAQVMILLIFATLPSGADVTLNPSPTPQDVVSESVASSPTTTTAVDINITDGEIRVEKGKTYRLVHDDFEVSHLSYFWNSLTITGNDTIYTDTVGTTSIAVGYYPDGTNTLTYTDCVIHIYDVAGTIDFSRDKIFVEKGKSYLVNANGYDFVTLVSNSTIISTTSTYMITANQTGTTNIWGQYYNGDNQYSIDGCIVDVFEAVTPENTECVAKLYTKYLMYDSQTGMVEINNPEQLSQSNVRWHFLAMTNGYYVIQSASNWQYITVTGNGSTQGTTVKLANDYSAEGAKWKILKNHNGYHILVPKCAEMKNLVAFPTNIRTLGSDLVLTDYYGEMTSFCQRNNFLFYDDTKYYLDNYYDISFPNADPDKIDTIAVANEFVINLYDEYNIPMEVGLPATYKEDLYINECDCEGGDNQPCSADLACSDHHKRISNINDDLRVIPGGESHIKIVWADRAGFAYCSGDHDLGTSLAVEANGSIQFYYLSNSTGYLSEEYWESTMSILLAHEVAHAMGLPDVYEDVYNIGTLQVPHETFDCVMSYISVGRSQEIYDSIVNDDFPYTTAFCSFCAPKLSSIAYEPFFELTDLT